VVEADGTLYGKFLCHLELLAAMSYYAEFESYCQAVLLPVTFPVYMHVVQ